MTPRQDLDWRPDGLHDYVGQEDLISQLEDEITTAVAKNTPLPHMIFDGRPGLGKTSLVEAIAQSTNRPLLKVMGPSLTDVKLTQLLVGTDAAGYDRQFYLTNQQLARPWILFIDECEKMSREITENFHFVMEAGADGRFFFMAKKAGKKETVKCGVPAGTVIMACNYRGDFAKVGEAMINRCGIKYTFQPYKQDQIYSIVQRFAVENDAEITGDAVMAIANRSLGVPRNAINLLKRVITRSFAAHSRGESPGPIDTVTVEETCGLLGIDTIGLSKEHNQYLKALADSPGGTASIDTLASMMRTDKITLRLIEQDLLENRFINVASSGRTITEAGLIHAKPDTIDPVLGRTID
jgi:Holliday junction DNA helicase RuvB